MHASLVRAMFVLDLGGIAAAVFSGCIALQAHRTLFSVVPGLGCFYGGTEDGGEQPVRVHWVSTSCLHIVYM